MSNKPIPDFEVPDDLESKYVNFVRISHTLSEFVMDFSLLLPGAGKPTIDSRLVMSPVAAKLFLRAMSENLGRFEAKFGEIILPGKHSLAEDLFRPNPNPNEDKGNEQ